MSDEITKNPLPLDFYKQEGWLTNLVDFYGNDQKRLPTAALQTPMDTLTKSMKDVTHVYGKFPDIVYKALGQCIDSLFREDEYIEKVYDVLADAGKKENRPLLIKYADGLLNIRKLFAAQPKTMKEMFKNDISLVGAPVEDLNSSKFCTQISNITRIHANQIRRIISEMP